MGKNKEEGSVWRNLDVRMLPVTDNTLVFGEEFMLIDNLGQSQDEEVKSRYVALGYPFKISFTCILFCAKGYMNMKLNLEEYRMQVGDVMVGLPGTIGETKEISDDCEVAIIAYAGQKAWGNEMDSSVLTMFQKYFLHKPLLHISDEEFAEAIDIYHHMRRKLQQTGFKFVSEALNGYMQVLASCGYQWITNYFDSAEGHHPETRQQQQFAAFLDFVRENYAQQRDIAFYADKMCLTPKYLSSIVYKASGRFAGEWIKDYVILDAKAMLKSGQYTVQQVCDNLNFSNASFFGKYFKAAVGVSPGRYMSENTNK